MPGTVPVINLPTPPGGHLFLAERYLPGGSEAGAGPTYAGHTFTIRADDGIDDLTIGGYAAIRDGVFTPGSVAFGFGRLSVTAYDPATGAVSVRYDLIGPHESHPGGQQRYGDILSYEVVLTDRDGDAQTAQLVVQIRDDEKVVASSDNATAFAGGAAASGNVVTGGTPDTFTADGFGGVSGVRSELTGLGDWTFDASGNLQLAGRHGVLTLHSSGAFTYVANADAPAGAGDLFSYWVSDGDGDQAQGWLTIRIEQAQPPPGGSGQVLTSDQYADTLTGGTGADTLNAGQGPDQLTGGGGADAFVYGALPWNAGRVTDFTIGSDRLDLSKLFAAHGYAGSDPVADGRVSFQAEGGGTLVLFDADGAGGDWPFRITILENVSPAGLTWAQLQGGGGGSSEPPPPSSDEEGAVLTSDQYADTLTGGSGADTLNAGRGPDQLTGAGGADRFVFGDLPWNAGRITDFEPGADLLDLSGLYPSSYAGTDPIADGRLEFRGDGAGNTQVYVDWDGPSTGDWPFLITTLQGVAPEQIGSGDWLIR